MIAIVLWATLAGLGLELQRVPPFLLLAITLCLGSLVTLPWIREWKVPFRTLAVGVFGLFGFHFFLFQALRLAPPIEANLINYLWPLLLVLLSPLFFPDFQLRMWHITGAVFGFLGATVVALGNKDWSTISLSMGYLYAVGSGLVWALYTLMVRRLPTFSSRAVGLFGLTSGLLAWICHFISEPTYALNFREWIFVWMAAMGPMGASFFFWDLAVKRGDPRVIGSLAYFTPLLSTSFLIVMGGGHFHWHIALALLLIVGGAALSGWGSRGN